jgi:serine/threonine protein kinase
MWSLREIEAQAFALFAGLGIMQGAMPRLTAFGDAALMGMTNNDNVINITCSYDGDVAFGNPLLFNPVEAKGKLVGAGLFGTACTCDDWPCDLFTTPTTNTNTSTTTTAPVPTITFVSTLDAAAGTTKKSSSAVVPAVIVIVVLLIVLLTSVVVVRRYRRTANLRQQARAKLAADVMGLARNRILTHFEHIFSGPDDERALAIRNMADWLAKSSVPTDRVTLGSQLGDGRFGTLHLATLQHHADDAGDGAGAGAGEEGRQVVAKTCGILTTTPATASAPAQLELKPDARDLLVLFCAETYLMGAMQHDHIVQVVGVVMGTIPMQVMTEHMRNGDLKSYLRACRSTSKTAKEKLNVTNLLQINSQVASACVFLEGLKVVHRGIMTTNVLVGANHTQIKLSGFGSLREVLRAEEYVKVSSAKETDLDIRWMAIECFTDNTFSVKSDVWSFAVLLWEVFSFARKPYGNFHPTEIAAEVRADRRLERPDGCPHELHDWMERCWSRKPTDRPTFASMQGVLRLLLLEGADELRARVAAATKLRPRVHDAMQFAVPMRGFDPTDIGVSDCGRFQLVQYQQTAAGPPADNSSGGGSGAVARAVRCRLGVAVSATATTSDVEALKTVFAVLQELKHDNVATLLGCSTVRGFVVLFDGCLLTLAAALHRSSGQVRAGQRRPVDATSAATSYDDGYLTFGGGGAAAAAAVGPGGCLTVGGGGGGSDGDDAMKAGAGPVPASPMSALLATHASKIDAALQMALGIEYLHAENFVHGRLSSASFYFSMDGKRLQLLCGNVLHNTLAATGATVSAPAFAATTLAGSVPSYLRWSSYEVISKGQHAATTASDVYSFGVLVWELFANNGVPHEATWPVDDDAALHASIIERNEVPSLVPPSSWNATSSTSPPSEENEMLRDISAACLQHTATNRPWISGVASVFLDEGPERWEQDRTQLAFVEKLGSGQFGDVNKMTTKLFSNDASLEFVAVKMLKVGTLSSAAGYSGYAGGDAAGLGDDAAAAAATKAATLRAEFLAECNLMKQFRHPNLVQMLGFCTVDEPLWMILEFSVGGSLDDWLPVNGPKLVKPTCAKLIHILHQVALGFLALGRANIIHRDLAARNVRFFVFLSSDFAGGYFVLERMLSDRGIPRAAAGLKPTAHVG